MQPINCAHTRQNRYLTPLGFIVNLLGMHLAVIAVSMLMHVCNSLLRDHANTSCEL